MSSDDVKPPPPEQYDEEEARDTVPSMHGRPGRAKVFSDITGMMPPENTILVSGPRSRPGKRTKTVSDITDLVISKHVQGGREQPSRRRQKSSSDVIVKFGQIPTLRFDDLKLAEEVQTYGALRDRVEQGSVSEKDFTEIIEEKEEFEDEFEFNHKGLTSAEAAERLEKYGRNELPEKSDPKWLIFLRLLWAPMPIMIWIAVIIEIGIQNYIDMAILLAIQFINASISFYETNKAGNAIAALKNSLKPQATCKRDGSWQVIDARLVVPGDMVLLGSGSAIPADCRVNGSEIDVDQAALTGESLPVTFYKGDSCKMGSTVVRGEVEVRPNKAMPADTVGRRSNTFNCFRQLSSSPAPTPFLAKLLRYSKRHTSTVTCRRSS